MSTIAAAAEPEKPAERLPGEVGIWVFIFGDLMVFSLLFSLFLYYRGQAVELFTTSQAALNQTFGVLNTALMLTSSLLVALAVNAARRGMPRTPSLLYGGAFLCGAAFLVVKVFEYGEKIGHGIGLNTNDFYMLYFMLTGIHLLHVVVGMGVLVFLAVYARRRGGVFADGQLRALESGSCFWHVVDLLWIVLFALLYLVR